MWRNFFEERGGKHRHYMLQTFTYAEILHREGVEQGLSIAPALYFVHHARGKAEFTPLSESRQGEGENRSA